VGVVIFFVGWLMIHLIIITFDGLNDTIQPSDVAVVLGNKVYVEGPSKRLQGRLDRAVALYQQQMIDRIIVSGGIEPEGLNEAVIMAKYLEEQGIASEAILLDEQGDNTYLTALNTQKICHQNDFTSVVVISQFYHLTRIKLAFRKVGFHSLTTAHARYFEWRDFYSLLREFFAYYHYLLY
jgi:vancomycin permeability regulator SanA